MGKRKKQSKPQPKKKRGKLAKIFDCPFCGHEGTVDCNLDHDNKIGSVECRVCGAKFRSLITRLDEEVDLYHKWIDACEDASKNDKDAAAADASRSVSAADKTAGASPDSRGPGSAKKNFVDDLDDDDFGDEDDD